ncbi:hypothetical protein SUGI_0930310 [Cryptomeria japonica]|nr:hypothetical protein SUGI_0930310 [Cryptomeria japonica]
MEVEYHGHAATTTITNNNNAWFTTPFSSSLDDDEFGDFESVPAQRKDEGFSFDFSGSANFRAPAMVVDNNDDGENEWGEFVDFNTKMDKDVSKPLPLFLFGDEELDDGGGGDNLLLNEFEKVKSSTGTGTLSGVELNDFIATLYKQAEKENGNKKEAVEDSSKGGSVQVNNHSFQNNEDLESSDPWEFKDAFSQHSHANANGNNGIIQSGDGDDEKELSFSLYESQSHSNSELDGEHCHQQNEDKLKEVGTFYDKLRAYSHSVALGHLSQLEKTCSVASQSNLLDEADTLPKEIQAARAKLEEARDVLKPHEIWDHQLGNIVVEELFEHLHHPSLLVFDSAFSLSELIAAAKGNIKVAVDLYRHTVWVLLLVSTSVEYQRSYLNVWATITSACVTELQHGLEVWNRASDANVHMHILSHPQGKSYFASLLEIFKVSEILRASMKLFTPWILLNPDQTKHISRNLKDCMVAWAGYGSKEAIEQAFHSDDGTNQVTSTNWKGGEEIMNTVESMEKLCPGDALYNANQASQSVCRLSLLPTKVFDGIKVVDWSGQSYFLPVANLWANCVSCKPPYLPLVKV